MYATISPDVKLAATALRQGRAAAVPTGTSYALAVDALQGHALQRLRRLKGRPAEKSFSVFLDESAWDEFLRLTDRERAALRALAGRPLTLLIEPTPDLTHLARDGLVALRVIDHPLMAALAAALPRPLTATSANRSGEPPCFTPACVRAAFSNPLPDDYLGEDEPRGTSGTTYDLSLATILDGGELSKNPPTTIAKINRGTVTIIRQGTLPKEVIENLI